MLMLVTGGMQDWNYLNSNCFELTIELGCFKYPPSTNLQKYWPANEYALLVFMAQVKYMTHVTLNVTLGQHVMGKHVECCTITLTLSDTKLFFDQCLHQDLKGFLPLI